MRTIIWAVVILALIALIVGGTVKALAFLLWVAPILLVAAVVLYVLNRSAGRRIP